MAQFNKDDELDFGPCICGHEIGDHGEEGECEKCVCREFTESDGVKE